MKTKNKTPLYALYISNFISATGDAMAAVAVPWFVFQSTGSAIQTGTVAFFSILPIILAMFFGGTMVDRIGYKRVSVFADLASGITMALIPILYITIGLEFWQLIVLIFLGNLMDAPGRSARQAMLPELAEAAGVSIDKAASFAQGLSRATIMVGAPLAGVLIGFMSAPDVLLIDAITFLISAIAIQLFIPALLFARQAQHHEQSGNSYWQDMREGFSFVRNDSLILTVIVVVMITNMIDSAISGVVTPVYVDQLYGEAWILGVMMGVFGLSAVSGTILYGIYAEKFSRRMIFIVAFLIVGLRMFLMAIYPPLIGLLAISALSGIAAGPINPIISVVSYQRVPEHMRARVFGLTSAGVLIAMPFGALVAGYLLESIGMTASLMIYGAIYILAIASLIINRHFSAIDDQPVLEQPEAIPQIS